MPRIFRYMGYNFYITRRSNIRQLSLKFARGEFYISANTDTCLFQIQNFLDKSKDWIKETRREFDKKVQGKTYHPPLTLEEQKVLCHRTAEIIKKRLPYWSEKVGIGPDRVSVGVMKTRWGSARSSRGITFNALLCKLPFELIDAVIVHELCHLLIMEHSPDFYRLCCSILPGYMELDQRLDGDEGRKVVRLATGYYE